MQSAVSQYGALTTGAAFVQLQRNFNAAPAQVQTISKNFKTGILT
jgi:hypothetical protein